MSSSGKYQTAEEWLAQKEAENTKNATKGDVAEVKTKLTDVENSIKTLKYSIDNYNKKLDRLSETIETISIEPPAKNTVITVQQASMFSISGLLLGVLLSFLVFRKMTDKLKRDYESRLSETRASLESMIRIMLEKTSV